MSTAVAPGTGNTVPVHYIQPITRTTFPTRHVFMDSESFTFPDEDDTASTFQSFRLAVAQTDRWSNRLQEWVTMPLTRFRAATDLWEWVGTQVRKKEQTVLWCHNLGYDARITRMLDLLPAQGWVFEQLRLDDTLGWAKLVRPSDGCRLTLADFWSWVPTSLEAIGQDIGFEKLPLPEDDASEEEWFARCETDVTILRLAWRRIHDWLWTNELGPFRPTGASTGWAVFKHNFITHPILCHQEEPVREREREAAYAGRCEAFQPGVHHQVYDYDFQHAYVSLCVNRLLPTQLLYTATRGVTWPEVCKMVRDDRLLLVSARVRTTADTPVPVLPARHTNNAGATRIVWPCGTFTGTWWLDELDAASGQLVSVEPSAVSVYRAVPALHDWAVWMVEQIERNPEILVRRMAKHWARVLVGRFGMRYPKYVKAHDTPTPDLWTGHWIDGDRDTVKRCMQIGRQVFVEESTEDGRDTSPAVMSYVMMLTRLRLLEAIRAAGYENTLYCDTDGLLVNDTGKDRLECARLHGLRVKQSFDSVTVLGPKQLMLNNTPRVSGLPKPLSRNDDGSYLVEEWERLGHALRAGRVDTVRVTRTSMYVSGRDGRRLPGPDGGTIPLTIGEPL